MGAPTTGGLATPALLRHLIDDAALFPPGNAPMAGAVPAHLDLRAGPLDPLVGPFLCPATRLPELLAVLPGDRALEIGLIVDTGLDGIAAALSAALSTARSDDRLRVVMVEVAVPSGTDLPAGAHQAIDEVERMAPDVRLHVELPRSAGWEDALDVLAGAGRGAKFRTGGLAPELFPSDAELAAFIVACRDRSVPFKCTAGLHHAVRHTDPATGFRHHGVLNIIVATARAVAGDAVEQALAADRPRALADEARAVDPSTAVATRALFTSYGSCSIDEPVGDLQSLGLLP